jgi:predicted patatin/cPLA2 family phospholipase
VYAASFFLADQVKEMVNTWENLVHDSRLINYSNVLRGQPMLDLDYMIRLFRGTESFLHLDRLFRARPSLHFVLTSLDAGTAEYFDAKRGDIYDLMRASSAVPWFYPPVDIGGRKYFDGGASDCLPVEYAMRAGCTDITVVMTEAEDSPTPWIVDWLQSLAVWRFPSARRAMMHSHKPYRRALEWCARPPKGLRISLVRPRHLTMNQLTRSRDAIVRTIRQGSEDAERYVMTELTAARLKELTHDPTA